MRFVDVNLSIIIITYLYGINLEIRPGILHCFYASKGSPQDLNKIRLLVLGNLKTHVFYIDSPRTVKEL